MYNYSPIKKVYIKNFRNIGEATIDFTESPIVSLIGENEQGKTSVVKAIAVCAMHATPRDQKDYIRDGTKGFGVAIELEDGTQVVRMKMASANQYRVSYPKDKNGEPIKPTWEASKIDSGLPKAVQEVMGMIEEPETKEFLHIRTYEDQLLFVTTASSTNYKVMYNALQISQLVDAIKLGSKEANNYKTSINQTQISAETLQNRANGLKIFDLEPLQNIRDRLKRERDQLEKIEKAMELQRKLKDQVESLGELAQVQSLSEINQSLSTTLSNAGRVLSAIGSLKDRLSRLEEVEDAPLIDLSIEQKLEQAISRIQDIEKCKVEGERLLEVYNLPEFSISEVSNLQRAIVLKQSISDKEAALQRLNVSGAVEIPDSSLQQMDKFNRVIAMVARNTANETAIAQIDGYCNQITEWFKAIGVNTETCPKCGETIIIDMDKQ